MKLNPTSTDYIKSNSVQNSPVQDFSFQDFPARNSLIQGSSLSLYSSSQADSSDSLSFGQDLQLKVFLDMDGVLTDFTGACERLSEHMMFWYTADKERFWSTLQRQEPISGQICHGWQEARSYTAF
ncbi:hypothetical protein [Methanosarcina horonobensis]|uniref:hypothetical protein n=1 Tax=Methanosarcina horonobensis TaxID=418008 RepID=UPI0022B8A0C3|nr:hypothetical protein [Methanosarcina horonobensis]